MNILPPGREYVSSLDEIDHAVRALYTHKDDEYRILIQMDLGIERSLTHFVANHVFRMKITTRNLRGLSGELYLFIKYNGMVGEKE